MKKYMPEEEVASFGGEQTDFGGLEMTGDTIKNERNAVLELLMNGRKNNSGRN